MAKGYWIGSVEVDDMEIYKKYIEANAAPFAEYGARFLVRAGQFTNPEGTARSRNVVIEFPSYAAALECYDSASYQAAKAIRTPVSVNNMVIVEGYDG
ncbi:Uncharacterized conserved protein, DUF1330 family [Shimia gijangensis]|uniref:Uncharacterized conserved protein, DUF1330 family n=1 Tax=Shimia gijangensis TaxID=1470563 RepID=A0A1M6DYZ2_9RHOB|nr:DUF1330 domain-containing protein [Shimia gijangensis]SHI78472.1 Uncharacterized conserved protein, DUF1330 family [Shimia gijangensis]